MYSNGYAEIVLVVEDVIKSAEFYRDVVKLIPMSEPNPDWAWFYVDKENGREKLALHRGKLLYEEFSPHPEGKRWGHVHFALNIPNGKLAEAVEHLKSCDIDVYGPQEFKWMNAISYYFYDPDGNLIEFWMEN